jgi:hypothetical protein
MKPQAWIEDERQRQHESDHGMVTLSGTMNGVMTPIATIFVPSGSALVSGAARMS